LRSSGAGEAISFFMGSREESAAVRTVEDGAGGEGEDALSRKEFPECCPLIWSQPHTLTVSQPHSFTLFSPLALWLYLTSSGFSVTAPKGSRVSDRHGDRLKMQSSCLKRKTMLGWLTFSICDSSSVLYGGICIRFHAAPTQEGVMKGYVNQNGEWEGWEKETKEEGMQSWLEEEEGKGHKKRNVTIGECPFHLTTDM